MKTNHCTILFIAAFGVAVLPAAGSARTEMPTEAVLPPTMAVASLTVMAAMPGEAAFDAGAAAGSDVASARWADIKDCTYDMRAQFFAGFTRLEARVDDQIRRLTARRAAMTSTTDTREWDFAMKEMGDARTYLKSMGAELRTATPETWNQQKETVGRAWVRTQAAYDAVKTSTTN